MLEFFRRYQRYFFLIIAVMVISSFLFFGTYSTFGGGEERKDRVVAHAVDGSPMMLSEVQKLARFIAADREDAFPNFCNDGVLRYDVLKDRLGELLVGQYFDVLKEDLAARLDKAKRFRSYAHPEAPFLSAQGVWNQFLPALNGEVAALQAEGEASPAVFSHLARLYQYQNRLQPEILRRILIYQHQQYPWLTVDQRLSSDDLALFGFHTATDWFGHNFIDLSAEFILNGASAAEEKGYRVSLEEAKGDLIHNFQESIQKLKEGVNFHHHLRMLGFDERGAAEVWRKVLLFRKYFHDVGDSVFVDGLPYRDFAGYAKETAIVQKYQWPLQIRNGQDLAELQFYIKTICPKGTGGLPNAVLSVEEVEKQCPELVQTTYRALVAETTKSQVALRAAVKQVWQWQTDEKHWTQLKQKFSLPAAGTVDERFKVLERLDPKLRAEVDAFSRNCLVDQNPSWINEALEGAPKQKKTWTVSGDEKPDLGPYARVDELEKVEEKHILPFASARGALAQRVGKVEGEAAKDKNPFAAASTEALAALKKNPTDPKWVQSGVDPLLDQFKLERKEQSILRTSQESWMREQAFLMLPDVWSPIQISDDGQISFFYLQEKQSGGAPILDQLAFGKETLAIDAKAYVVERLLQTIKSKKAIVIPVPKEDE